MGPGPNPHSRNWSWTSIETSTVSSDLENLDPVSDLDNTWGFKTLKDVVLMTTTVRSPLGSSEQSRELSPSYDWDY